jgi:hypothetical protein
MRSVSTFPSGTLSQEPLPSIWCTQSVEQVTDPQPACSVRAQRQRGDLVDRLFGQRRGQAPVGVQTEVPRQTLRQFRYVVTERHLSWRAGVSAPLSDVVQECRHGHEPAGGGPRN